MDKRPWRTAAIVSNFNVIFSFIIVISHNDLIEVYFDGIVLFQWLGADWRSAWSLLLAVEKLLDALSFRTINKSESSNFEPSNLEWFFPVPRTSESEDASRMQELRFRHTIWSHYLLNSI